MKMKMEKNVVHSGPAWSSSPACTWQNPADQSERVVFCRGHLKG